MSQNGASSVFDATGDYSGEGNEVYWEFRPTSGIWTVCQLHVHIGDSGVFDADKYGNNVTISNGVIITKVTGTGSSATRDYCITDPDELITDNTEWTHYVGPGNSKLDSFGSGNNFLIAKWDFLLYSDGVVLNGNKGQALRIALNDNFSDLTEHKFLCFGHTTIKECTNP